MTNETSKENGVDVHTPGPWAVTRDVDYAPPSVYSNGPFVARCADKWTHGPAKAGEVKANAYLIAAAPELLAMCEAALRKFEEHDTNTTAIRVWLEAAINKARGATR